MNYKELLEFIVELPRHIKSTDEICCYDFFTSRLNDLNNERKEFNSDQDKAELKKFREIFLPYILQANFCRHVYQKPYGYPGDYESQEMIWNGRVFRGDYRYSGTTDIGKYLNALTFDMDNMRANEHRVNKLRKLVLETKADSSVASIGCGSCLELWNIHKSRKSPIDLFLLDQEQNALISAEKHIPLNSFVNTTFINANILKFILKQDTSVELKDFIYVFGLLDYFPLKSSKRIVERLFHYISHGGSLLITNAHPNNPTKTWMEYGGGWFLNYKTKEEIESIVPNTSEVEDVCYSIDEFSVYQYVEIIKK